MFCRRNRCMLSTHTAVELLIQKYRISFVLLGFTHSLYLNVCCRGSYWFSLCACLVGSFWISNFATSSKALNRFSLSDNSATLCTPFLSCKTGKMSVLHAGSLCFCLGWECPKRAGLHLCWAGGLSHTAKPARAGLWVRYSLVQRTHPEPIVSRKVALLHGPRGKRVNPGKLG